MKQSEILIMAFHARRKKDIDIYVLFIILQYNECGFYLSNLAGKQSIHVEYLGFVFFVREELQNGFVVAKPDGVLLL